MNVKNPIRERLTNALLLNASFIDNLGLMHGKMGIAIFFFHLARETKNSIYEDYAGELIDEIYEEITSTVPIDFENGLVGIGWGIEYLVQNGFIDADTDEVLEEFDNRIFKKFIDQTPTELNLLNGLIGIGAYFLKRIQNPQSNDENIQTLINKQTLIHLIDEFDQRTQDISGLIAEPQAISNNIKQDQTEETTTNSLQTTGAKAPPHFDLLWDYSVLLWFLGELHQQNIFNFKVEKIIERLIAPLTNDTNLLKRHSSRLLLALALTKLHQTIEPTKHSNCQTISNKFLSGICRETILAELPFNNATVRCGSSGIAWVYLQLHLLSGDESYRQEFLYWQQKTNEYGFQDDNGFAGFSFENEANAFGLLEGLAGVGLLDHATK
ncbi:MAG: lanthionine synthetase LanC family protein [Draconibacterium sp.]